MKKFIDQFRLFKDLNKYLGGYYLCYYSVPDIGFYSYNCFPYSQIIFLKKIFPVFEIIKEP